MSAGEAVVTARRAAAGRDSEREILVVGGGPAGLAAALHALDAGRDVGLLEASPRLGGYLATERRDGYSLAVGPHALTGAPQSQALARRLGVPLVRASAPPRRFLVHHGRLVALPSGPLSFATSPLLSPRAKLRLLAEPLASARGAQADDSVATFFRRRLGREAADRLVGTLVSGIHAGDPERLEARSAFPRAVAAEERSGSILRGLLRERRAGGTPRATRPGTWSPVGGLGPLGEAAARALGERAVVNAPARRIERSGSGWIVETDSDRVRARRLVLALPPAEVARLVAPLDAEASRLLASIPSAPVALVHLGGRRPDDAPSGFGALVPRAEGLATLGILFSASLFPDRAPTGRWLSTSFVGGVGGEATLERDDSEILTLAADDAESLVGFRPGDELALIRRHPRAIPQVTVGHAARVETIRSLLESRGDVALAGGWLDGVGIERALESGARAAAALATAEAS